MTFIYLLCLYTSYAMNSNKFHESYTPPEYILSKYADILVNFALHGWKWLQLWESVWLRIMQPALPLLPHLQQAIVKAWWHMYLNFVPQYWFDKQFYAYANNEQLKHHYSWIAHAILEAIDHEMVIYSPSDLKELQNIDIQKINLRSSTNPYFKERSKLFDEWKLWYTLAYYPTDSMAQEAWMTLEEYWQQVINACYLDEENPVKSWKNTFTMIHETRDKLTDLKIQYLHIKWADVDLKVKIWSDRKWLWGTGRNIPSYETFVSPDWRWTQWRALFSEPLYTKGTLISWIKLEFKDWIVINATAEQWQEVLLQLLQEENFNKIWEFSLTDKRISRIDRFMAETLFDENRWWEFGNFHIALGDAYKDSLNRDQDHSPTNQDFEQRGFNTSLLHSDIVSTTDRRVVAILENWEEKVIYEKGQFTLD